MTEKTFNYTKSYFGFQMGRLKTCTVFSVIFALLGVPLILTAYLISEYADPYINSDIASPLLALGVICVIGTVAMSYIAPIISLKHLYTKTNADNILSLPLTGNQRFLVDIIAPYVSYALPFLISCGITALIQSFFPQMDADMNFALYAFKGFFILLMFSSFNMAVTACCGRITEAVLYPIGLNLVFFGISAIGGYMSYYNCVGISDYFEEVFCSPAVRIWPVGNAICMFLNRSSVFYAYAAAAVVLWTFLTFIAYKKRRAENIGKSFVFKPFFLIASTLVAVAFILLYASVFDLINTDCYDDSTGIAVTVMCVITLIILLILEVINYRKIHSILKFGLKYILTLGGTALLCFLLTSSEGFGATYYIPDALTIESATISVHHNMYTNYNSHYNNNQITVYSTDAINLIRNEHDIVIDKAVEYDEKQTDAAVEISGELIAQNQDYNRSSYYYIDYTLKDGRTISRRYYFNTEAVSESEGFWETLYQTVDYRTGWMNEIEDHHYMGRDSFTKTIRLTNTHSGKIYIEKRLSESEWQELLAALEADLAADTSYGRHNEASVGTLQLGYYYDDLYKYNYGYEYSVVDYSSDSDRFHDQYYETIYSGYTNTIAFLEKIGTVPTSDTALEDAVAGNEIYMLWRAKKVDTEQVITSYNYGSGTSVVFITAEEFKELASHHVDYRLPDDEGYCYGVVRGVWSELYEHTRYDPEDFIKALSEIGIDYDNEAVFENSYIYYNMDFNFNDIINESENAVCEEIFSGRTVFDCDDDYYYYD